MVNAETSIRDTVEIDALELAGLRLELAKAKQQEAYKDGDDDAMEDADKNLDGFREYYRVTLAGRAGQAIDLIERRLSL